MRARDGYETAIGSVDGLHRSPRADNTVRGSEREVMQILMEWMSRRFGARIGRFVDKHSMNCHQIGSTEGFRVIQNRRIFAILEESVVDKQFLQFIDCVLIL